MEEKWVYLMGMGRVAGKDERGWRGDLSLSIMQQVSQQTCVAVMGVAVCAQSASLGNILRRV